MSSGNLLFFVMMISGILVSVSSGSWVICWMGIELSFLGVIPLLMSETQFSCMSKESSMKYFCVQALGSGLLLLGGLCGYMSYGYSHEIWIIIFIIGIFIKLGLFPMHFWVPSVVSGLNWVSMFLLLGLQKVAPFALLANISNFGDLSGKFILLFGGLSAIAGSLIGLNQTSLRPMLGSSSIAHSGWAAIGAVFGGLWTYFFLYCLSFLVLICFLIINDDFFSGVVVLSLSGLPPFMLFSGKLMVLKMALSSSVWYMFLIGPVIGTFLSLFFYLKFFYSFYLNSKKSFQFGSINMVVMIFFLIMSGAPIIMLICFGDRVGESLLNSLRIYPQNSALIIFY